MPSPVPSTQLARAGGPGHYVWTYVRRPDRRFTVEIPELTSALHGLPTAPKSWTTDEPPLVLSASERRSFTANTRRDWFAGTPWHKHVPARLEALPKNEAGS